MEGIVVKFDKERRFGFIRSKQFSEDVFVHLKNIREQQPLSPGQKVEFDTERVEKGLSAINVIPGKKQTSPFWLYGIAAFTITVGLMIFLRIYLNWHLIVAYLASINLSTFLFYGYDKMIAGSSLLRVPEWILHSLSIGGGSPAGLVAQKMFRHKTIKGSFQLVYWAIVIIQVGILTWLIFL
jgi:uncharacterized membrane protein YsdA (DUF1294 family)/cold shock CspA family protein